MKKAGLGLGLVVALSIGSAGSALATPVDVSSYSLNFGADDGSAQTSDIGLLAEAGFSHTYEDVNIVGTTIDAVANVVEISNLDSDDIQGNGPDNRLDGFDAASATGTEIDLDFDVYGDSSVPDLETGHVTFRIDFYDGDSGEPLSLDGLVIGVEDLDDRQFVEFYGISAYELSTNTRLDVDDSVSGAVRFTELLGYDADDGTDGDGPQDYWVEVEYDEVSYIVLKAGANQSGSVGLNFLFEALSWTAGSSVDQPVALVAHDLSYDLNGGSGTAPSTQSSTAGSSAVTVDLSNGEWAYGACRHTGWNTAASGQGLQYEEGDVMYLSSDLTLFAQWSCPVSEVTGVSGIFLTVTGVAGSLLEGRTVIYGSYAVSPSSTYRLTIQSITNPRRVTRVLDSGIVNDGGHLEASTLLPRMEADNYRIIFEGVGADGQPLRLTNHVGVNASGRITSISAEQLQPTLN